MTKSRSSMITDWRIRKDADLPEVPPGEEREHAVAPQRFVVLRRIIVQDLHLVRLQIGAVEVPFELENTKELRSKAVNGLSIKRYTYRLIHLAEEALQKRLVATGAAVAPHDELALAPGLEVRMRLRNEGAVGTKLRLALLVQEEEVT